MLDQKVSGGECDPVTDAVEVIGIDPAPRETFDLISEDTVQ
jgi:hypothetical protein